MLHSLEKYGLDIIYEEFGMLRQQHVNRSIWVANAKTCELLNQGYLPSKTGSKELNENWYKLTSQLIDEIWGVIYPDMIGEAAEWSEWGAKITNDDRATHPTTVYGGMYSAAFFEKDIYELIEIDILKLPDSSPYVHGIKDVMKWHQENKDWKTTRQLIYYKYFNEIAGFEIPYPMVGSIVNDLNGIMALLYGEGDFTKTVAIATTTGYDCDKQAATVGGLLGVINSGKSIPDKFTMELPSRGKWDKPFNDSYINYTRDNLPNFIRISEIVDRLVSVTEKAIHKNGGKKGD